ncbi:acyl-CoA dehydrogenase family protein [Mycobacterium paraintracellulare]|uniref:acyl-CoA dehydrogenase family protein n=1 Tax=Mycobacterium paraintracellulare TaxID=1138383 RepID=UPI0019251B08|nr:acyl-CoA dehydrogenase family protein [Mycobacterium paraintracellulare]BCP14253.1 acyl-CoA dehydrogenase [Mycobacterium paraintracellulare]
MTTTTITPEQLVADARELNGVLLERADVAEQQRRVPNETIETLFTKGFFDLMVPRRWGGQGARLQDHLRVAAELAKGCPATSWIFTLIGYSTAMAAAYLPEAGAQVIFDGGAQRPLVCGVNGFTGTAKITDDGYVVTGKWGFASGCYYANWFFGGVRIYDAKDEFVDVGFAFMPMSALSIKDTWHVAGMRGTGSNTVIGEQVVVPQHMMMTLASRRQQEAEPCTDSEYMERIPFAAMFSVALMGPLLGMSEAAAALVANDMHTRGVSYFDFDKKTKSGVLTAQYGQARMHIDTAWLHILRAATTLEDGTVGGQTLPPAIRARCRMDAAHGVKHMRTAMELLLDISGASSFAESNPLQRYWRDLSVGSRHAWINTNLMYEAYARAELGLSENTTSYI